MSLIICQVAAEKDQHPICNCITDKHPKQNIENRLDQTININAQ
jgi:hypothetical protein